MNARYFIGFGLFVMILAITTQPSNHRAELTRLGTDGDSGTLPLQFTSSGHVLGFTEDGIYVASETHVLHIQFANARPTKPWRAAELARVTYPNLWRGVTLTYDAPAGAILRSTYRIDPFADPAQIRLRYNAPVTVEADGRLAVEYAAGVIRESAPVAWQERAGGGTESVAAAFTSIDGREIGFDIGAHDPARALFVDPSITWNTFIGESGSQEANIVVLDGDGNLRVVGSSSKIGEKYQVFLAKLDGNGNPTWYKVFGGSGNDFPSGMVVDGSGNAYIIGNSDLPWGTPKRGWSGGYADDFVAKFDTNGNLLWNTFLGGNDNDQSGDLVLDSTGLYATGMSAASWGPPIQPFPGDPGTSAMFLANLDVNGNFLWNTFIGAVGTWGNGITASGGALYLTGYSDTTWGSPIRPLSAGGDAFAAKVDLSGNLVWNTFLGGTGYDFGHRIIADGSGNLYVLGESNASWGSPIRPFTVGDRNDTFVTKLDGSGNLLWNTFLGGTKNDISGGIALYGSGNVYVVGSSYGTWGSPWRPFVTNVNAYIAKLDSSGNLLWNGFIGGSTGDLGDGVAVNGSGDIYLVGGSNTTWGSPINPHAQGADGMLVKISDPQSHAAGDFDGDGRDEVAVDFGAAGVWMYDGGAWTQLTAANPEGLMAADVDGDHADEILADLGSLGLWLWNAGAWNQLSGMNVETMAAGDVDQDGSDEVVGDFGALGLWLLNGGAWTQLSGVNADCVAIGNLDGTGGDEIIGDFGPIGLWVWNAGVWTQLSGVNADGVAFGDTDGDGVEELVGDFGATGLWLWDAGVWTQLSGVDADAMITAATDSDADDEIVGDFGALGLWLSDSGAWTELSGVNADSMIRADVNGDERDEIAVDFGSIGLWLWNAGTWSQLSGVNPEFSLAADVDGDNKDEILVDFGALGLWLWNEGVWTQISALNPE